MICLPIPTGGSRGGRRLSGKIWFLTEHLGKQLLILRNGQGALRKPLAMSSASMRSVHQPELPLRIQQGRGPGELFNGFLPAMSDKSAKAVRATIRGWMLRRNWTIRTLEEIAQFTNPVVRGWIAYYGRFYRSACIHALEHLNLALVRWAMRKYKRFRGKWGAAYHWLGRIAARNRTLFAQWEFGSRPSAGR